MFSIYVDSLTLSYSEKEEKKIKFKKAPFPPRKWRLSEPIFKTRILLKKFYGDGKNVDDNDDDNNDNNNNNDNDKRSRR